jgi:predicted DNA-binding transcriptional regulator AlpA
MATNREATMMNHPEERDDQNVQPTAEVATDRKVATLDDLARLLRGIRATISAGHAELLDAAAAADFIGVSRATWDRMRSAGLVPMPVLLNGGTIIRWRRVELAKWIEDGCPACR